MTASLLLCSPRRVSRGGALTSKPGLLPILGLVSLLLRILAAEVKLNPEFARSIHFCFLWTPPESTPSERLPAGSFVGCQGAARSVEPRPRARGTRRHATHNRTGRMRKHPPQQRRVPAARQARGEPVSTCAGRRRARHHRRHNREHLTSAAISAEAPPPASQRVARAPYAMP